jgi:hypothetical protein
VVILKARQPHAALFIAQASKITRQVRCTTMLPRFYLPTNKGKARYSKADSSADHATETGLAIPAAADLALDEHTAVSVANGCTGSGAVALVVGIDGAGEAGRGSAGGWVGDADDLGLDWGGRSGHADSTAESRSTGTRSHLGSLFEKSKRLQRRWASPLFLTAVPRGQARGRGCKRLPHG